MDIKLKNGGVIKLMITKNKDMYEYFLGGRRVGVYDPKSMEEHILILQNTLGNELSNQIRDEINAMDKSNIPREAEENQKIQEYAEEIGVQKIRDIYTIEIPRTAKKEKGIEKEDKEKDNTEEKEEEIEKEQKGTTTKDVNIKQTIELSERANDLHDVKKWLGANIPPQFKKLAIIDSSNMTQMKDANGQSYQRNSTTYDLALVDKDGNVEPLRNYIPQLEQRDASGSNPISQKYQVDKDGEVEEDAILSEYEIAGRIIQIDNKEMGRIEVNIGREEHSGNDTLGTQLRDSNSIYATDTEVRRVMGEYEGNGVRNVDENLREIKQHEKQDPDCQKEHTYEDIDGEFDTISHGYMTEEYIVDEDGEKYTYDELASRWGKYVDGKPDKESIKEWLEDKRREDPEKTVKDLIEEGDEEYEDPRAPEQRI